MSCLGPMARSVEDLALIYKIIAGPDGRDVFYRYSGKVGVASVRPGDDFVD